MDNDTMVFFGGEVKALGDGKVGGYLVRFTGPKDPDIEGDFFDAATELGVEDGGRMPVYYQHGMDGTLKSRRIGRASAKYDDVGLWLEAQLEMRDEYERAIYEMAEAGKLGWSSGAAGHLVEREPVGKSWYIKSWPIAEASLTPTPAEPRNGAMPIKSLLVPAVEPEEIEPVAVEVAEDSEPMPEAETESEENLQEDIMDESEIKALLAQVADEAVKKYAEAHAPVVAGGYAEVVEDEADRALKGNPFSAREFFIAVKNAALSPHSIDKRLLPLKSQGLNELVPSEGGFLVQQDIATGILQHVWGEGSLLSRFNPINVSGNGLVINAIDETSRANGHRYGGVLGYWLEEGGSKIATKPAFRQINLKLRKVCASCYATDELLEDASALESWLVNNVPNELRFRVEAAIVNGDGVAKPLGILQGGALISATRTDANEIDALDIGRMWSHRYAGVNDYIWLVNQSAVPQLTAMTIGNMPAYLPPGGLSGSQYGSMMGRPVIETEYNPYLGTLGDILLVSPSQYAIITKGGIQSASSIHVSFLTDETVFRFVYRVDGCPGWSSAVTAYDGTHTVSPFVALAAST